jgi:subtilisin family serine protease
VTEQDSRDRELALKVSEQVWRITDAFDAQQRKILTETAADGGVSFMYAGEQILVRDEYLERVQVVLGQPAGLDHVMRVTAGVVLLTLVGATGSGPLATVPAGQQPTVIAAVQAVDEQLGEGIATPDHVLTVTPGGPCPATEPEEVYAGTEPYPGICTENSGAGVLIYIADTGLLEDAASTHSWLDGVQRALTPEGVIQDWDPGLKLDPANKLWIPPYAGHGTFVAGVTRCMAPKAEVIVSNVFKVAGSALESDFVGELRQALALGVDIFNLSITAPTRNKRPMLAFERWLKLLRQYQGVVCVAAAGNNGSRLPSWPAAFPQVVSVGALTADGRDRTDFSNYGGWVDVYAPGRDLINAYTTGTYKCDEDPYKGQEREFYGMARWSGTSFSTPLVTGLIAARMHRTGENGQEAAAALLRQARTQAIPGVGAILLPCSGKDNDMRART